MKIMTHRRAQVVTSSLMAALAAAMFVFCSARTSGAAEGRKLTIGAYISGAKIALYGESQRPDDAQALLDSCEMFYGAVPESYALRVEIHSTRAEKIPSEDLTKLREEMSLMVKAFGNLESSCANAEVKDKLKKDCKKLNEKATAIIGKWYTDFYNKGIEAHKPVEDRLIKELSESTVESEKTQIRAEIDSATAKAATNFQMASILKPKDPRALLQLANIYSIAEKHAEAIPYQKQALEITSASDTSTTVNLLNELAYSYYATSDYNGAAETYKRVLTLLPAESQKGVYKNIVACYNSLSKPDSVRAYNLKVLALDPGDASALSTVGGLWFNQIQTINQSISDAKVKDDKANVKKLQGDLTLALDSASEYLKRASTADTTDTRSLEFYAIARTLAGDHDRAGEAWKRLATLKPTEKNYWLYLGDSYVARQKFKDAIPSYEKYVELDPENGQVWGQLAELYRTNGAEAKAAAAQAKADKLKKPN